ncbi:MAG: DNRLRE domain-containing protein [Chloroflexota bacterium]|nr:DNRLRE domain-containing protein [Anaerolineales bacterium]
MKIFIAVLLTLILAVSMIPMVGGSKPEVPESAPTFQSASTLIFRAQADARVEERHPDTNTGTSDYLEVVQGNKRSEESYIRFNISGISDVVQSARLRLYSTTDSSQDGPALYASDNTWVEKELTWNNRPKHLGSVIDDKGLTKRYSWIDYDVTSLITANGVYSFALVGESNDGVRFSSRESSNGPQLIITLASGTPTAAPSPSPSPTVASTASPSPTPSDDIVLVGAGDISTCDRDQDEFTAQLLDKIPGTVFAIGDNVYKNGTYQEYIDCYDPTWGRHKLRTKPVPGNHDYNTSDAAGYFQYFNNVEPYYAYDLGPWRIYALNSEINASVTSAQMLWLQADLLANPRQCVLAYWHTPRWSSGSRHGSNPDMQSLWQVLYEAGAEVVVNGHEHSYERFAEMDGSGTAVSSGLREFVVGTGGAGLYEFATPLPASEVRDNSTFGVIKFTLHETAYDWEFVPVPGSTFTDGGSGTCH